MKTSHSQIDVLFLNLYKILPVLVTVCIYVGGQQPECVYLTVVARTVYNPGPTASDHINFYN